MKQHDNDKLVLLLFEKLAGTISKADDEQVEEAIASSGELKALWEDMRKRFESPQGSALISELDENHAWEKIVPQLSARRVLQATTSRDTVFRRLVVAASILVVLGTGLWLGREYFDASKQKSEWSNRSFHDAVDVQLRLADGTQLELGGTERRKIDLHDVQIHTGDDRLTYTATPGIAEQWNTLIVPAAKDYKLSLADGTEIWLNSRSSLRFPFGFNGPQREVYLEGEAYFNVAKDQDKPFIVHAGQTSIEVLGTEFNVEAYTSETITSLITGAVKTTAADKEVLLEPGYQVIIGDNQPIVRRFDEHMVTAWMSGTYYFHNQPLSEIAVVMQRWYDVEVIVENGGLAKQRFTGAMEKHKPIQELLDHLTTTANIQVQFREGALYLK